MKTTTTPNNKSKRKAYTEVIASLLLIFFIHSSISNYVSLQSLENLLAFYTAHTKTVAPAIVISEIVIAVLLFIPRTRTIGFICTLLFGLTASIIILQTPHYPHDFGGIFNITSSNQKWILLTSLLFLSIGGIVLSAKRGKALNQSRSNKQAVFT